MKPAERVCLSGRGRTIFLIEFAAEPPQNWQAYRGGFVMMKLYWSPRSRSFSALWLMEETGQPYERVLTDISKGDQKAPDYLAITPLGKGPRRREGEATRAEAAAICPYVAERYPQANLAPPLGGPLRARYLYWLFFSPGCVEPAMGQLATTLDMTPSTCS